MFALSTPAADYSRFKIPPVGVGVLRELLEREDRKTGGERDCDAPRKIHTWAVRIGCFRDASGEEQRVRSNCKSQSVKEDRDEREKDYAKVLVRKGLD